MPMVEEQLIESTLDVVGQQASEIELVSYEGVEGLSMLFRFELLVASFDPRQDLTDWVRQDARLKLQTPHGVRYVHGVISRVTYLEEGHDQALYRVELLPRLWLLTHQQHCRIFQNRSTPDIVSHLLNDSGVLPCKTLSQEQHLIDGYEPRAYCVQYRESDFNFIARLLEDEGIFYYFEHDEHECRFVLGDSVFHNPFPDQPDLPYVPPSGMTPGMHHVHAFCRSREVRPDVVVLRDYNYEKPPLDLQSTSASEQRGKLVVSDYPGKYDKQSSGHRLARLRREELACTGELGVGRSNCPEFAPGRVFNLHGHPLERWNAAYTVTKVRHVGRQGSTRASGGGSNGALEDLDPHLRPMIVSARSHDDPVVRGMAEALAQQACALQRERWPKPSDVGAWVRNAGETQLTPTGMAAARGGDPRDYVNHASGGRRREAHVPLYECEFECILFDATFRPPRLTPKPVLQGSQTAVVVGPEDEEIYTDELGRVKVRFFWDRDEFFARDGRSASDPTCWIRVNQPWAGKGYGGMTIPRIGQEVIVDFLEGDPDRPIITGRVYNAEQRVPQSLPKDKVRSSLRSQTYKGTGSNEITMDDTAGQEHFYMKSQYDKTEEIGNNRNVSVGVDSTEVVGNNKTESVGNNQSTDVTNAYNINCDTMMVNAKTSITLQCGAARIHMNQAGFISITGTVITSAATVNNSMVAPMTEVVGAVMLTQAGAVVLVEGGATHVRGEVLAALKGAEVNVIADGDNVVQGGQVKIN